MLRCGLDALHASCRATTLKTALLEHLLPQLGGELRAKLLADAQQVVLQQVLDKLWASCSTALDFRGQRCGCAYAYQAQAERLSSGSGCLEAQSGHGQVVLGA